MNKEQIIKIFKNKNNRIILIIFIIGVVLMIAAQHRTENNGIASHNGSTEVSGAGIIDEEARLESMLSQIEGAGRVSVMITYYSGAEKSLAYETKTSQRDNSGERSEDKKAVTSGGEPVVIKEVYPSVKGVIVAADGADTPSVKAAIREAVVASLGVGAHRVCIFKKEEE